VLNYRIGIFLAILFPVIFANFSQPKIDLKLQSLSESEYSREIASPKRDFCGVTLENDNMIFMSHDDDALIKMTGKLIKIKYKERKNAKVVNYVAKDSDAIVEIEYGEADRSATDVAKYKNVRFNVAYKGQKVTISAQGYCGIMLI
jgi:hypothetical protein